MKYYRLLLSSYTSNDKNRKIASQANGKKIPNANYYFNKIRDEGILKDTPIFDYFFLQSYDKKKYWEWKLNDVHKFIGEGSQLVSSWLISLDLKLVLESFNLPKLHHFYPSKLLYKGDKYDYYIFQFEGNIIYKSVLEYINFEKSIFWDPRKEENILVHNIDEFLLAFENRYQVGYGFSGLILYKRLVLKEPLDFFPMNSLSMGILVSERIKTTIEEMGITGFEFSEVDYEVMAE